MTYSGLSFASSINRTSYSNYTASDDEAGNETDTDSLASVTIDHEQMSKDPLEDSPDSGGHRAPRRWALE